MPLIKDGAFAADTFARVDDEAALPDGAVIVSLTRFQKDRETLLARNAPLGVQLKAPENPETLGDDVHRLSLIVLEFPVFRDGRGFSWARMLRERMKFTGEIRATGHFLYDQLSYLRRVGVNAFDVPETVTLESFNRAMGEMTNVYQPSADGKKTIFQLRHDHHT